MNPEQIQAILRGEHGANPNLGIEEDDILVRAFLNLTKDAQRAFWPDFALALKTLIDAGEDLPVYLAARFVFSMGEISPPCLPRKTQPFAFLPDAALEKSPPSQLAGILLAALVLELGQTPFWERAVDIGLHTIESGNEVPHAMAAVVYAFIGLGKTITIPAEKWSRLFRALRQLPRLPRMELLELLVGVEKQTSAQKKMSEELDVSLEQGPSTKGSDFPELEPALKQVLQAWLDLNKPHPAIEALLKQKLGGSSPHLPPKHWRSPRYFVEHSREAA